MSELVVASSRPRTSRHCVPSSSPSFPWRLPSNALSCPFFFSNPRIDACFLSPAALCVFSPVIVRTTGLSCCPFLGVMAGLPSASALAEVVPSPREPSHPGGTTLALEGPIPSWGATVRGEEPFIRTPQLPPRTLTCRRSSRDVGRERRHCMRKYVQFRLRPP